MQDQQADLEQFLLFEVAGNMLAVPMESLREVVRVPAPVPVPLGPPGLKGLINLRGGILPLFGLRELLGLGNAVQSDASRALVIDQGALAAFAADRTAQVIAAGHDQIERGAMHASLRNDWLRGLIKDVRGHGNVPILDFAALLSDLPQVARAAERTPVSAVRQEAPAAAEAEDIELLGFLVAGQEFAVDIAEVREVVRPPEQLQPLPGCARHLLGVMALRDRLVPLFSLHSMFGLSGAATGEKSRVLVFALANDTLWAGLILDAVSGVLRVPPGSVDRVPGLLARSDGRSELTGMCRIDGGHRLVAVIEVPRLFPEEELSEAMKSVEDMEPREQPDSPLKADGADEGEPVLVMRIGNGEYGLPLAQVQEIVRPPEEWSRVPKAPEFIEGVFNLRGTVVPVIDQRVRFGLAKIPPSDRQRVVVLALEGMQAGLLVDSVSEVVHLQEDEVGPAPALSDDQAQLIPRVANLHREQRMILLLDAARLVGTEAAALAQARQGTP